MDLFNLRAKITLDTSEYEKGLANAQGKTSGFGQTLKGGFGKVAKIGSVAMAAAGAAVVAFGKSSIDAGMTFDKSMSQVAATMGLTMGELESTVGSVDTAFGQFSGNLREYAQFMGKNTAFSASEAADALNYMALAGYDAQTSMQMLPNVLNLAAAGGMELATASDMITDTQTALGLSLDETTELVDKMAKTSSKSNTSVSQLGDAMLTIGGTAKVLSGGTTELSTAYGILADNGIKGSEAGTKLRNILLAMNPTTDAAVAAWDKLGVSAYDAEGNLRPLEDVFGELSTAMEGMTDQERQDTISKMFNKQDIAAVNALLDTSADRWDELAGEIDDAEGAAQKMADVQLDNLEGDVTLFKSALEGAQIAISDALTPSLRGFVQEGTSGLQRLTDAFGEGGFEAAIDVAADLISEWTQKLVEGIPKLLEIGGKLLLALGRGIIAALPSVIKGLATLGGKMIDSIRRGMAKGVGKLANGFGKDLKSKSNEFRKGALTMIDSISTQAGQFIELGTMFVTNLLDGLTEAFPTLMKNGTEIIKKIHTGIINAIPGLITAGGKIINSFVGFIMTALPTLMTSGAEILNNILNGITTNLPKVITAIQGVLTNIGTTIKNGLPNLLAKGSEALQSIANGIKTALPQIGTAIGGVLTSIGGWITSNAGTLIDKGSELFSNVITGISNAIGTIGGYLGDIAEKILDWINGDGLTRLTDNGTEIWNKIKDGIVTAIDSIGDALGGIVSGIAGWVMEHGDEIVTAGVNLFNWLVAGIKQGIHAIGEWIGGIIDQIVDWINGDGAKRAQEQGEDIWNAIKEGFVNAVKTAVDFAADILSSITTWVTTNYDSIAQAGKNILTYIVEGIVAVASDIATGMLSLIGQAATWIVNNKGAIITTGKTIVTYIINGIIEAVKTIGKGFVSLVSNIASWIMEHSGDILALGQNILDWIVAGIRKWISDIKDGFDNTVGKIKEKIDSLDFGAIGLQIIKKIKEAVVKWLKDIGGAFLNLPGQIAKYVRNNISFSGVGTAIINGIKKGITGMADLAGKIKDVIQGALDSAASKNYNATVKIAGKDVKVGAGGVLYQAKALHQPYLFNKATIFGKYQGDDLVAGEAGPEMLLGVNKLNAMLFESVQGGMQSMMGQIYDMMSGMQTGGGNSVLEAQILDVLQRYLPDIADRQLVLDTGAIAGAVAPGVNAALGTQVGNRRRYNA